MDRCKMLLLALAAIVGLGLATGCDQKVKDDAKEEKAEAKAAEDDKKEDGAKEQAKTDGPPLEATGPVAVVDGTEITAERFNEAVERRTKAMGGRMPPPMANMMKKRTVDRLIDEHLIDQKLEGAKVEVEPKEVDEEFNKFKERFPNEKAFESFLTRNGITADKMKENLQKDLKLRKLLEDKYGIEVTEKDAKDYYEKNEARFEQPEQVKARHILIKTEKGADQAALDKAKKRAEDLAKEAKKSGTDFAKLAEEKSEGPSASRGGDLGFFTRRRMVPEFSEAAFNMKPGEISDPVKTQFGYHVIKVEEKKEAGKVPYDEAKEKIMMQLERQKFRKAMKQFLAELKKDVKIERKEDNIKVNVSADAAQGGPGMMGGGKMQQMQLQKALQKKLQQQQQQKQQGGDSKGSDPTKLKLQEPNLGK
ncbi:peptidylprolyl isomerase [Persicimonas caeni]|nr:peptidylprolyl isomerase [Persicimonas caeni]